MFAKCRWRKLREGGRVELGALTIEIERLVSCERPFDGPLAFVDLADVDSVLPVRLPPCPVIGLGDPRHPLAGSLDAVIEPPVVAERLAAQVLAQPQAAAVAMGLLRMLPALDVDQALTAESLAHGLLQGSEAHRAWIAATAHERTLPDEPGRVLLNRDAAALTVTLDNPGRGNAVDRAMRDALHEAFELATLDRSIARIDLRGSGRSFSLGAELGEFGTTTDPAVAHDIRARTLPAPMIARCAERLEVHVQGACVGAGLEMAAWARRITASPHAWFQLPELAMGIIPGAGGCVSLSRRIGRSRTALLILSGRRLSARAALDWGLIDAIVDEPA
jgi:enoyl-CoA hydratase